jgi:hypothetical protein
MGGLFKKPEKPKDPPKPAPMPVVDDEARRLEERRKLAARMSASGRASTILTDSGSSDKLGG